jgi:hypothetical protein
MICEVVNELVNLDFGAFPSLKRRGGRAINEMDPFRNGAAGVVSSAKLFRPEQFSDLPLLRLRAVALALRARLRRFGGFATSY